MGPGVQALLGLAPLAAFMALMLGLRWSALRAGVVALGLAVVVALSAFAPGGGEVPVSGAALGIAAEGGFLALGIVLILLPALALHALQQRTGATDVLQRALGPMAGSRSRQGLLVGWLFAAFLEGAAGFGTPIALAAPMLVSLGYPPVQAVVLALLGHAAAVAFGALGTPVLTQAALTGIPVEALTPATAILNLCAGLVLAVFFRQRLRLAGEAPGWAWPALAAGALLLPATALALIQGPSLASLGGALLGMAVFIACARGGASSPADPGGLLRALMPYGLLVVLLLATRALVVAGAVPESFVLEWTLQQRYSGRLALATHPGVLLFVVLLVTAAQQSGGMRHLGPALRTSASRLAPVALALVTMLLLSRLLLDAGMLASAGDWAVVRLGPAWPWLAPAVGALGSFVTGSATASNVLFSELQARVADGLGLPVPKLLAAQTVGAAVGNLICPHNIVAGAATVGLAGRESEILRAVLLPCVCVVLVLGVVVGLS
jgi:lactate permease